MALGKIASPRSLGKAAAEALKKLEQDFRKTSESSVRELCAAANRELKYLTEILTSGKFAPARKTPPNPPGAIFAKPSRRQTPSDLRPLPEALELPPSPTALAASTVCANTLFLPESYLGGLPETPAITSTVRDGVLGFAQAFPRFLGRVELQAVSFAGAAGQRQIDNMEVRVVNALLFAGAYTIPPIAGPGTLVVSAPTRTLGSSLVIARGAGAPSGMGIIRCTVGLGVLALDANGGIAEIPHTSINSLFVWATPLLGYDLGVRTVDSNVPLQLSLPVETGYQIWVTLQFELFVGVDIRSNLYVDANFSHLRSFYQGPGLIGAPVVGLVVFC